MSGSPNNPQLPFTKLPVIIWQRYGETEEVTPVDSNNPIPVTPVPSAAGAGLLTNYLSCTASTNATLVKASPGKIFKVKAFNNGAVPVFLKLYNLAALPVPVSSPVFDKYEIVAGSGGAGLLDDIEPGQEFDTGIGFAVTANFSDTDNTAIGAGVVSVTILYR